MATAKDRAAPPAGLNDDIGEQKRLDLYRTQVTIREAEQRAYDLFLQNLVKGTSHLSLGQEAVAAGFAGAMVKGDLSFCTYRGHAHTLARGVSVEKVLGELMQRDNGLMRGKGGSMHLTSVDHGVMGSYAIIGAHLPIACGAAWRAQYKGAKDVSVCFFGDGTTNIGAFHEALNFAAVWKLPVVFVCENNLYMEYTPIADVTAVEHPAADRASAYGLERIVIDGNDADVVYRTAQTAFDKARAGEGPSLIECMTYRHSGHSRADPAKYRPEGELDRWKLRDPIKIYRERLLQFGVKEKTIADIDAQVRKVVDDATEACKAAPNPPLDIIIDRRLRRWRLGMAELTYRDAVIRGIAQEMARDPDVVFLGEDVAKAGGVFKATVGLYEQFGPLRVRDTPISEQAIMGAAMGAAMTGLKPIAEIMFSDFFAVCFDYIANEFPKSRYMSNGQVKCPLVVRTGNGAGSRFGAQHSQSVENWCMMIPGLKVVAPSSPVDVIGLLAASVRDPDPVIFLEHKSLYADQRRGAGRRDRRQTRYRQDRAPRQGCDDPRAGADGAARAGSGRKAQGGTRHRRRSCRRALAGAARHPDHPWLGGEDAPAVHGRGKSAAVRLGRGDRVDRRRRSVLRSRRSAGAHHHAAYSAAGGRHSGRRRAADAAAHRGDGAAITRKLVSRSSL